MRVEEVMTADVACCRPDDSDERAAQLMWENDCGVIPVTDSSGRTVGIVTDRDLCMAAFTRGRDLSQLRVSDAMSPNVHGCRRKQSLEDALGLMREHRVRRLPVIEDDGRLVGMLSMNDVIRAVDQGGKRKERRALNDAVQDTLVSICEHRSLPRIQTRPGSTARIPVGSGAHV